MTATDLLNAARSHQWSMVMAIGVVLVVSAVRQLPSTKVTAWTQTGWGAIVFAVLASLAAGVGTALAAHQAPWTLGVVMPAIGVAVKAVGLYEAQKQARQAVAKAPVEPTPKLPEAQSPK